MTPSVAEYGATAVLAFAIGHVWAYLAGFPPLAGGALTLAGFVAIDRAAARYHTGSWLATPEEAHR